MRFENIKNISYKPDSIRSYINYDIKLNKDNINILANAFSLFRFNNMKRMDIKCKKIRSQVYTMCGFNIISFICTDIVSMSRVILSRRISKNRPLCENRRRIYNLKTIASEEYD